MKPAASSAAFGGSELGSHKLEIAAAVVLMAAMVNGRPAWAYQTCATTHRILGISNGQAPSHANVDGKLDPPFSPVLQQGDVVDILVDAALPPDSSVRFITQIAGSPFPDSVGGPAYFAGMIGSNVYAYTVVVPYWGAITPGSNFRIALQSRGCNLSDSNLILPISDEIYLPGGLDGPSSITPAFDIEATVLAPTEIEVRWRQAAVVAGYNEFDFQVLVVPLDSQYPTVGVVTAADADYAELSGMVPGTTYSVEVYARDSTGHRITSPVVVFPKVTTRVFGAPGSVTITNIQSAQNPLCANGIVHANVDALSDDGEFGVVDAAPSDPLASVRFPFDLIEDPSEPGGYQVLRGRQYYVESNLQANAIIYTPVLQSCGTLAGPRFVAVHAFISGTTVTPLLMTGGTLYQRRGEMRGVVMRTSEFGGHLDYDPETREVSGYLTGILEFVEPAGPTPLRYGAEVALSVPGTQLHSDLD